MYKREKMNIGVRSIAETTSAQGAGGGGGAGTPAPDRATAATPHAATR